MQIYAKATPNVLILAVCGHEMYSYTGMIPCDLCALHTSSGPPIQDGYKQSESCPDGTLTSRIGATGPSQCKEPYSPRQFSWTGLQPCSQCLLNYYQGNYGQQWCVEDDSLASSCFYGGRCVDTGSNCISPPSTSVFNCLKVQMQNSAFQNSLETDVNLYLMNH